ncbi:MAG: polymer-forming cytoskeletal protein [Nitrospirae bacterium]|nr:polymer-forming cytoskeletal protein [Nitrospirota bacterium]
MFKKDVKEGEAGSQLGTEEIIAFLGKGTEFKGVLSYEGTVRIDGNIEGEIITKGTLVVGESAVINAEITVGTLVSGGKITGNINAKGKVQLLSPATVIGTIKTPALIIEEGVKFDGKCDMLAKEEKKVTPITSEKGIKIAGGKGID